MVSGVAFGVSITGTESKWWGGVKGLLDKIYGLPYDAGDILIINPGFGDAFGQVISGLIPTSIGKLGNGRDRQHQAVWDPLRLR